MIPWSVGYGRLQYWSWQTPEPARAARAQPRCVWFWRNSKLPELGIQIMHEAGDFLLDNSK